MNPEPEVSPDEFSVIEICAHTADMPKIIDALGKISTTFGLDLRHKNTAETDHGIHIESQSPVFNPEVVSWVYVKDDQKSIPIITKAKLKAQEIDKNTRLNGLAERSFNSIVRHIISPRHISHLNDYMLFDGKEALGFKADNFEDLIQLLSHRDTFPAGFNEKSFKFLQYICDRLYIK